MCIIAFLSYHLAHIFAPGWGPFSVCMHCLEIGVSWVLDLQVHLSLIIFPTITLLHYSISFISFSLFYLLLVFLYIISTWSGDSPQLIIWRIVASFSLSIHRTLIEILSLRRSSRQRKLLLHWHLTVCLSTMDIIFGFHLFMFRVCAFVYMF